MKATYKKKKKKNLDLDLILKSIYGQELRYSGFLDELHMMLFFFYLRTSQWLNISNNIRNDAIMTD